MCSTLRLGKSTDRSPWEIDISLITCNRLYPIHLLVARTRQKARQEEEDLGALLLG